MNEYPSQYDQTSQQPQRPQPLQPLPPHQQFPSQPGVPLPGQYPTYQPQQQSWPIVPQSQTPIPDTGQQKKKRGPWFWILIAFGIFMVFSMCISLSQATNQSGSTNNTSSSATDIPAPPSTPVPTATPIPTLSPAQGERTYKATTSHTTVGNLDKDGNVEKCKNIYFTCKILKFVKDDSGNTAGANVEAPYSYSTSIVQVAFPAGTDITQLNEGDIAEVWGTDEGVFSGQNAFGGTVQEVGITAKYINDKTTNYQTS